MQVQQADASQQEGADTDLNGEAAAEVVPPYTVKCANSLGDVRLQKCPSPEGQDVLYFTCQWERDGGGMYDVAKLIQPEVCLFLGLLCCYAADCAD